MMHAFRWEWTGFLVLPLLHAGSVLAVPPVGEFPHGDEWDYAFTAKELVEYGEIRLSDLPACPLVAHIIWGALFVRLFGYSYLVLRLSTLTMSFVGTVSVYAIARRFQCTRAMSVLAAAAIGLNPTTLCLSYTCMTDVTANALMLVWLAVLLASGHNGLKYSLLGVLAAACYLVRQTAWIPAALFTAISLLPGPLPGHRVKLGLPYESWLRRGRVYVLERTE